MSPRSQSASIRRPDAAPDERLPRAAGTGFTWPPPPEDLDEVALLQFPAELPAEPPAPVPPAAPASGPAGEGAGGPAGARGPAPEVRFLLEDFPRAGQVRPGRRAQSVPERPRARGARWVLALVAALGFALLIGIPLFSEEEVDSLPAPASAPSAPLQPEPYAPPPVDPVAPETRR